MQVPLNIREKILERLENVALRDLMSVSEALSKSYLRQERRADFQIRSKEEAYAYLAGRLPATWAAASEVLSRLREHMSDFTPQNMLDVGAGPGTCTLAVRNIWSDISSTLLEKNPYLQDEGKYLCPDDEWVTQDLASWNGSGVHDLVMAGYVLNEFSDISRVLEAMWKSTSRVLVLIEPGTPFGHDVILRARDWLIAAGAYIAAPCPHMMSCPLKDHAGRWCHFSVRLERSKLHKAVKGGELGYEDEKFSYLIATREKTPIAQARIIGHPRGSKVIEAEICAAQGAYRTLTSSKRDENHKKLKKARWGDSL